jgi:hypothetical protein
MRSTALVLLLVSAFVLVPTSAIAADTSEADQLFAEGRELLEKKNYLEACEKLQKSEKLAPAVGTLLNLGFCWEQLGKHRSAMDAYAEAEILARESGDEKRAQFARGLFNAVEPKVMKLTVKVEGDSTPGLVVTKNGRPFPKTDWGKPIASDPDDLTVAASAPGRRTWQSTVTGKGDGAVLTVVVPALEQAKPAAAPPPPPKPPMTMTLGPKRLLAVGLGTVGLVGLGVGTALAISASGRHDDAASHCDPSGCDQTGVDLQSSAASQGNVATVFGILGLAAIGAGVYFWITGGTEKTAAKAFPTTVVRF